MMKQSKFCLIKEINGKLFLANIRTGHMVKFTGKYMAEARQLLENCNSADNTGVLFQFLKEKEYIIDSDTDEDLVEKKTIEEIKNNMGQLNLIIMPTDDCNFRCPYCYEDHEKKYMSQSYLDKIAKYIDKNIDYYTGLKVEWFGGEPLLQYSSVIYLSEKLVQICRQHKKPFLSGMTTNGYFLTVEVFERLRKLHFVGYQITVDGFAESHDKQRCLENGGGSWNRIIKNLRDIKETPCRGFTNITIRTNFTVEMLDRGKEFLDFLNREFGDDRRFNYFIRTVSNFGGERINQMQDQLIDDKSQMINLQKYASSIGLRQSVRRNSLRAGGMICYASKKNYYVLASDEIVRKSTCNYSDPANHIGVINDNGDMLIDREKENLWLEGYSCANHACQYRITCAGDGCPRNHIFNKQSACVWNAAGVEEVLELLSYNDGGIETYTE